MKEENQKFLKQLGKRLKSLRKRNGLGSQEQFAAKCELSRSQYSRYENGMNITILILKKIVEVHNINFKEFFSEGFENTEFIAF